MTEKFSKYRFLAPTAIMALIFTLSHQSSVPHIDIVPYYDKLLHITAYAVLGAAWVLALKKDGEIPGNRLSAFAAAVALSILFGASDEYHQIFVPGRSCEAADILADAVGAIVGAWAWTAMKPMKKGGLKPPGPND